MTPTVKRSRAQGRWWLAGVCAGVAAVVTLGAVLAWSRTGSDAKTKAAAVSPEQSTTAGAAATIPLAVPDIRLTAAAWQGGRAFVLSQQAERPTIVFAMASWCISCIPEAKALIQLHKEHGDRVTIVVLDVDSDDTEAMLERFAKAAGGAPGVWALDTGSVVTRAYNIRSLDTTIVIAGGREVSRTLLPQSIEQLRAALAKAQQTGQ
jgi:thiol-disulfide isomerase/thioredoxin